MSCHFLSCEVAIGRNLYDVCFVFLQYPIVVAGSKRIIENEKEVKSVKVVSQV